MALSADHSTLTDAIAHATEKREQLQSSNVARDMSKNETKISNSNNGNSNNNNNNANGNSNGNGKRGNNVFIAKKPTTLLTVVFSVIGMSRSQMEKTKIRPKNLRIEPKAIKVSQRQ